MRDFIEKKKLCAKLDINRSNQTKPLRMLGKKSFCINKKNKHSESIISSPNNRNSDNY